LPGVGQQQDLVGLARAAAGPFVGLRGRHQQHEVMRGFDGVQVQVSCGHFPVSRGRRRPDDGHGAKGPQRRGQLIGHLGRIHTF
jgi:hypothetical protein